MPKELKGGFTTGAAMAAGVKAALHYLVNGENLKKIQLIALDGTPLDIEIKNIAPLDDAAARVEIIKQSGDDPDITNGAAIFTTVRLLPEENKIIFKAGKGIGRVTKPGLSIPVGEAAINSGPRQLVANVVREILGENAGLEVEISIPVGEELAKKTLNPILGVVGGLSIIGTTGVLRPMSEDGFKNSLVPQIDVAKAAGYDALVFVPGMIGQTHAIKYGLPPEAIVQTSNFIGFMLEAAAEREVKEILLFGHIGKLGKVAAGVFNTHNRVGDARLETLAAYGAAHGLPADGARRVLAAVTTEEAMAVFAEYKLEKVYDIIATKASERAERFIFNKIKIGTVLVTLQGDVLGFDETAREIGEKLGWKVVWLGARNEEREANENFLHSEKFIC